MHVESSMPWSPRPRRCWRAAQLGLGTVLLIKDIVPKLEATQIALRANGTAHPALHEKPHGALSSHHQDCSPPMLRADPAGLSRNAPGTNGHVRLRRRMGLP